MLDYEKKVLQKGVLQSFRGRPAVLPKGGGEGGMFYMLTNASLTTAVYRAAKSHPDNAFVQATLKEGLQNCKVYDARTPDDVLDWIIEGHNDFHQGSGNQSIVQFAEKVVQIDKASNASECHASARFC